MRELKINPRFTDRTVSYYLNEAKKYPPLKTEEELKATKEQLIKHNMLFVLSVAKQYGYDCSDLKDMIQEGTIGLIRAAETYDSTKGFKFISHAVYHIRGRILDYIYSKRDQIRVPANYIHAYNRIKNLPFEDLTDDEIKELANVSDLYLKSYYNKPYVESSDELSMLDEDEPKYQLKSDITSDSDFERNQFGEKIVKMLDFLTPTERIVIEMSYLEPHQNSFATIGERIGLSYERARQIHNAALKKLRDKFERCKNI